MVELNKIFKKSSGEIVDKDFLGYKFYIPKDFINKPYEEAVK